MYEIDLETNGYDTSDAALGYEAADDLGAGDVAGGALVGGLLGVGLAGYAGYSLGDYINDNYLEDAGVLPHLLVDVAGIGLGLSVLGTPFFYGGAFIGGLVGGTVGVEEDLDGY